MVAPEQNAANPAARGVDLEKVRGAITPVLAAHGVELFDLEWLTDRAGWTLRVMIERIEPTPRVDPATGLADAAGGVTLEDCVEVSRDISSVLDVEDLIQPNYHLEVSSPGLERKLRGIADFVRFRGHLAKVKLARPAPDGQRVLRGPLEEAPEGRIAVLADGKRIEVPAADVAEARLVYELPVAPKPGKSTTSGNRPRTGGRKSGKAQGSRERSGPR